jgi:enediyne biosynthesis protein CalE5
MPVAFRAGRAHSGPMPSTAVDFKERQKTDWSRAAAAWEQRFDWYSRAFQPVMQWCCDAAGITTGSHVLDIACGSGQPAFMAAHRVGPKGKVVAIDLAAPMVAAGRRTATARGAGNIEFLEMDAEHLLFPDASFDAVTCSCGLMFFPDAARAVGEMRRVLKPACRLSVAVWNDPSKSPFLTVAGHSVAQFFPPAPRDPSAAGAFRFAKPGALESLLRDCGFQGLSSTSVPMSIDFASASEYFTMFVDMAAGMKAKLDTMSEPDLLRLKELVAKNASPYVDGGRLCLVATLLCAAGAR